jgi:hypothetical protein
MALGFLSRGATTLRRAAIGVGASVAAVLCFLVWRRAHPPPFQVIDVAARAHELAAASPDADTLGDVYYFAPGGQVHLHIFGKGSTCHLHLHEQTEEATIPVWGSPRVTQLFAAPGTSRASSSGIVTKVQRYPEGTLIVSPPYCAHEWVNESKTEGHASLVFTLGGAFPGNLFVAPDDPRILQSSAPSAFDANADLAAFEAGSDVFRETPVSIALGSISEVLVRGEYAIAPKEATVTFVYTTTGAGHLDGAPRPIALSPSILVVANRSPALKLVADPGKMLATFVVRIPKKDE